MYTSRNQIDFLFWLSLDSMMKYFFFKIAVSQFKSSMHLKIIFYECQARCWVCIMKPALAQSYFFSLVQVILIHFPLMFSYLSFTSSPFSHEIQMRFVCTRGLSHIILITMHEQIANKENSKVSLISLNSVSFGHLSSNQNKERNDSDKISLVLSGAMFGLGGPIRPIVVGC